MERKADTARKVSPMAVQLRNITNLNEPPINPLKNKKLLGKHESTKLMVQNDSESKPRIKTPDLHHNKANITTGSTHSPFRSRPRHHTVKELIQNKENYEKNEILHRTERKSTLPSRNNTHRKSPITHCTDPVNVRRMMDQSSRSPPNKRSTSPISPSIVKQLHRTPPTTNKSAYKHLIKPISEPEIDGLEDDESLTEEHSSHDKTINEIPHFDEHFQLGRKSAIGRLAKDNSEISLLRPTHRLSNLADESCNRSYYAMKNNQADMSTKKELPNDKFLLKNKRFFDADVSCEFIILDQQAEMLM